MTEFFKKQMIFGLVAAFFCATGLTGCFWNNDPSPSPGGGNGGGAIYGGGESFIAVDWNHGKILAEQNADRRQGAGGLAQVTTALVALDWLRSRGGDRNALITVPATAAQFGNANPIGLQPGDRISIRDAIFSSMLADDPVSAEALGEYFGWKMSQVVGGGQAMKVFVEQMNALAGSIGMTKTRFRNAHGLPVSGNPGDTTARDMARLGMYALRNPQFNFYVAQSLRNVTVHRQAGQSSYTIKNNNQLLGTRGVDGVKFSNAPGVAPSLMVGSRRNDRFEPLTEGSSRRIPYRMVVVSLGSADPFNQTRQLIDQGWGTYEAWVQSGMVVRSANEMLSAEPAK